VKIITFFEKWFSMPQVVKNLSRFLFNHFSVFFLYLLLQLPSKKKVLLPSKYFLNFSEKVNKRK